MKAPLLPADSLAARAIRLVLRTADSASLFAALHDLAREGTGARISVLLLPDVQANGFRVASAAGLSELPLDVWTASTRDLTDRMGTPTVITTPLMGSVSIYGVLALGFDSQPPAPGVIEVLGDAFALAIERGRQQRESDLDRDLREALLVFTRGSESSAATATALGAFCRNVTWLLGADSAEVWQHDRHSRELVLVAATDVVPLGTRVATADEESVAVRGLREERALVFRGAGEIDQSTGLTVAVPLKGRRRALGTLLLAGVRLESGGEADLLLRADHVGRGLAASLENMQLFDDVLRSSARIARTEKLLALGQFVAGVAHELNNPLQGVLGHLELIRASKSLTPALRRDLALVYREADRAARIVRHLLVFAGSGRLRTRSLNLNLLARRVLQLRGSALRQAGIDVVRDFDAFLPLVKADGLLLQQAVLNIVMNAEQALAGGRGRLVVRTELDRERHQARLIVEDSGPGLTDDVRSRLFEPFFSTKDVGKGTGLGLAIAFGILKAHGGAVDAENHPGGGARFTMTLPVPASHSGASR